MYIHSRHIYENVNQAKRYLKENGINIDNDKYMRLKEILRKNLGYLGPWTEFMFNNNIDPDELDYLYNDYYLKWKNLVKDIDINEFSSTEEVIDHITKKKQNKDVKNVIKSLPSKTRNLVNDELEEIIFNNLKWKEQLKKFYSKKGGRYRNIIALIEDTMSFIENLSGPWNSENIASKLNSDEIVYIDEYTLIAWIQTYERSKVLGSESWCIVTDPEQYKNYTEYFSKQYFIWDFTRNISDKKSLIGVTVKANGDILSVHFKDDSKGSDKDVNKYLKWLKPFNINYIKQNADLDDLLTVGVLGFNDIFKTLWNKGERGQTELIFKKLCEYGNFELVKIVIEELKDDEILQGLNSAIRNNKEEIAMYILEGEYTTLNHLTLISALKHMNWTIIEKILEFNINLNKKIIWKYIVMYNRVDLMKYLLDNFNVNIDLNYIKKIAKEKGRKDFL